MTIRLVAQEADGKEYLIKTDDIGGANVVLLDIDCEAIVAIGDMVRMTAAGVAVRALADSKDNSNVIGLVEAKTSSVLCNIRVLGSSTDIFAGLDVTKEYYLSDVTPGAIGTTIPIASGHVVLKVGQPFSATSFLMLKGGATIRG